MASLANVFVGLIVIIFSVWLALTLFLPLGGAVMDTAVDLNSFDSPLIPSFFEGGVWWSFSIFILGMAGVGVVWALASMLELLGIGRVR
jgi:hypothetical protein